MDDRVRSMNPGPRMRNDQGSWIRKVINHHDRPGNILEPAAKITSRPYIESQYKLCQHSQK